VDHPFPALTNQFLRSRSSGVLNRPLGPSVSPMAEGRGPGTPSGPGALLCPQCGAPLPPPGVGRFVVCDYCGASTEVSPPIPPQLFLDQPVVADLSEKSSIEPSPDELRRNTPIRVFGAVIALVVVIVIAVAVSMTSQPQSNSTPSSVAHCSVNINASALSGPAPFTATFTAQVTVPSGVSAGQPMWQFGPIPPLDLNFTYGSPVNHTWDSDGTYGVHVSVPDSTGQGCWNTTSVDVI
jgi:hypothetical protein